MVKSGRGFARRSVQFCAAHFPWRSRKDDDFRDTSGVVMQRFQLGPGCLEFSRVPGIIASLALTKTLALICDIRKGRLSDVPAQMKLLIKLLQSGCLGKSGQLHLFVSLTSKATSEYWSAHALCTSECWTLLGFTAIFFIKCSNIFLRT